MKTRGIMMVGISLLVLTGASAGIVSQGGIAFAGTHGEAKAFKQARDLAASASRALGKGNTAAAISYAEAAVSLNPQFADYRVVLGQSYLKAGRFMSARQSFADALMLSPGNGRVALNLALAQVAVGEWDAARKTLDANAAAIPVSDRGLAMALAGDPAGAVELLSSAARSPEADAKTRQNLALAFALAGRWQEAKTTVSIDLAPSEVDARIAEWATFSRPQSASDQIATLLHVTPVEDAGQPVALALNQQSPAVQMAAQAADPVDSYMPGKPTEMASASTPVAAPAPAMTEAREMKVAAPAAAPETAVMASVRFMPRQEVVQIIPARVVRSPARPVVAMAAAVMPRIVAKVSMIASGGYYVQLGAYENAGVARDAWTRVSRRYAAIGSHMPQGMGITTQAGSFYRLSVGGFARADAVSLCSRYKARGGNCFVRAGAGDQVARWAQGPKLASR